MVVGRVAKFALHNPYDLAIVDSRVQLFDIEDVGGDRLGKSVGLAACLACSLIHEAEHALLDETTRFVANRCALQPGL
jgi:hypothetical protein